MVSGAPLALGSMLIFGSYFVVYKRYFSDYPSFLYLGLIEGVAVIWYVSIGLVLDINLLRLPSEGSSLRAGALLAGVVGLSLSSAITAIRSFKSGDASYVGPLVELAPPVVLLLELLVLNESISAVQAGGLLSVTAGVYLLNSDADGLFEPFMQVARSRPAKLALLSATLNGFEQVTRRTLVSDIVFPPETLVWVTLAGMSIGALTIGMRDWDDRPRGGKVWSIMIAVGLGLAAADHLMTYALIDSPASVVVPIISGQAIVTVVLGGELLNEEDTGRRTIAAVLTATGIALVALFG